MANKTMTFKNENLDLQEAYCKAQGHVLFTKAGAVTDEDFEETPPNGTLAYDSTNNKLMIRDGGAWLASAALS
jgi:hypothetical protein